MLKSTAIKKEKKPDKTRYIEGIGRRKKARARVRIYPSTSKPLKEVAVRDETVHIIPSENLDFTINEKSVRTFFPIERLRQTALSPLAALNVFFKTTVKIQGGGTTAQAEAIRLGLSRALVSLNDKWRPRLKTLGFLTRDPRVVERKKPGLRKARRPQQWRKR